MGQVENELEAPVPEARHPLVSVILPIRNEAAFIRATLQSVLGQDYPHDRMEVLVVDGMSEDGTRELVSRMADRQALPAIRLIDNPDRIVPTGLNRALLQARGQIFVRVDGHCEIAPDYVRNCVQHLIEQDLAGVGGPIETIGETPLARAIAISMSSYFGVGGAAFRTIDDRSLLVDTIAFPAYPRRTIERAGLFDEELVRNQDDEYNYRIRKLGGRILLAANIRSRYHSRSSLGTLWKQYYQYGFWKVRVLQKHPRQMRLRQFGPPLWVGAVLVSASLAIFSTYGRWLLIAVAGAHLLANLLASLWTAARRGWKYLPALPLVNLILHTAYGTGFLAGLIRFANRWGDRAGRTPTLPASHGE